MKRIIWSNMDLNVDDWRDGYKEFLEINEIDKDPNDENAIAEWMEETNNEYLNDARIELNKRVSGHILVIADLGLWNGRRQAYKVIGTSIASMLYDDADYIEWYGDGHNIKANAAHHDGTNHYEYRIVREDRKISNLLNAIYNGEKITRKKLNYYTRSLYPAVAEICGW